MSQHSFDADVIIVGAGPSGLSLATELALRGQSSILLERNDRTGVQPRAKTTNVRSMTQMRRWGLAGKVRERSWLRDGAARDVTFNTALFDPPIFTFKDAFCASPNRREEFPEYAEFIPQYIIEGILAEHVAAHPLCDLRFKSRVTGFDQDDQGVSVTVETPGGGSSTLRGRYMVGADGGRSRTRETLGIEMRGKRDLMNFSTLILRIPGLVDTPGLPHALFHWIVNPAAACVIGPMDRDDLWFWAKPADPAVSEADLVAIARASIGRDYPIEVVTRDNWVVHSLRAEAYRRDRVFLIGDACHLHSPFGGHGMNLGIGDGVDLGWKLAAVLQGWGSEALLDSYFTERSEVHDAVIDSATKNFASLSDQFADPRLMQTGPEAEAFRAATALDVERLKSPEFRSLGLVLGYRYSAGAFVAEPGAAPDLRVSDYRPTARPGHLLPHAWLAEGRGAGASLYDRLGTGYALIDLRAAPCAATGALLTAAARAGLPLARIQPGADLRELMGADLVLVRPDQHVAWRGDALPDPETLIAAMRGTLV